MRTICNTVRYQLRVYFTTSKPIMPFVAFCLVLILLYAYRPVPPADTFAASAVGLCFISAWIAMSCSGAGNTVSEQLIVLKLGSIARYQAAFTLFLALIGAITSVLAVLLPLALHAGYNFSLYNAPIDIGTILQAILLHMSTAFMGTALGAFFCPRIAPSQKTALPLVCLILIVGAAKVSLHDRWSVSVAFTWLFPPISEISEALVDAAAFSPDVLFPLVGGCLLYGGVLTALRIVLLSRLRFS